MKTRVTRSRACWDPVVTTISSAWAEIPSRAMTSRICSRSVGSPCPEPYCNAESPWVANICATAAATVSSGSAERYGIPPARETISGREATANSARISEAFMPVVRAA